MILPRGNMIFLQGGPSLSRTHIHVIANLADISNFLVEIRIPIRNFRHTKKEKQFSTLKYKGDSTEIQKGICDQNQITDIIFLYNGIKEYLQ